MAIIGNIPYFQTNPNGPKQSESPVSHTRPSAIPASTLNCTMGATELLFWYIDFTRKQTATFGGYWVVRVGCGQAANTGEPFCIFNLEVRVAEYSVSEEYPSSCQDFVKGFKNETMLNELTCLAFWIRDGCSVCASEGSASAWRWRWPFRRMLRIPFLWMKWKKPRILVAFFNRRQALTFHWNSEAASCLCIWEISLATAKCGVLSSKTTRTSTTKAFGTRDKVWCSPSKLISAWINNPLVGSCGRNISGESKKSAAPPKKKQKSAVDPGLIFLCAKKNREKIVVVSYGFIHCSPWLFHFLFTWFHTLLISVVSYAQGVTSPTTCALETAVSVLLTPGTSRLGELLFW